MITMRALDRYYEGLEGERRKLQSETRAIEKRIEALRQLKEYIQSGGNMDFVSMIYDLGASMAEENLKKNGSQENG